MYIHFQLSKYNLSESPDSMETTTTKYNWDEAMAPYNNHLYDLLLQRLLITNASSSTTITTTTSYSSPWPLPILLLPLRMIFICLLQPGEAGGILLLMVAPLVTLEAVLRGEGSLAAVLDAGEWLLTWIRGQFRQKKTLRNCREILFCCCCWGGGGFSLFFSFPSGSLDLTAKKASTCMCL